MKIINLDSIRDLKRYDANCDRYGDDGCIICGMPMKDRDLQEGKWVHLFTNGDISDYPQDLTNEQGGTRLDQGFFQVGCTCYRKFIRMAHEVNAEEYFQANG